MSAQPAAIGAFAAGGKLPKNVDGLVNRLHWSLMFTQWASSLRYPPSVEQIRDRFNVSRATGYRYKVAWEAAVGARIVPPPNSLRGAFKTMTGETP